MDLQRRGGVAGAGGNEGAGAQSLVGDVTDRRSVERALHDSAADDVFHLAGLVKAPGRAEFTRVNAGGVECVAAACAARPQPPVLVVVSSLAAAGTSTCDAPRSEGQLSQPVSNYGRSKLAGEEAAAKYAASAPITIVRPPIVFGPGDLALLQILRPIARWGMHLAPGRAGGERRFSLVFVDDLVEALLLAAGKGERLRERSAPGVGVYFISGDDHPTYAQLGRDLADAMRQGPPASVPLPGPLLRLIGLGGDLASRLRRRPGWVSSDKVAEALASGSWTCSSDKARQELGWLPAAGLLERLRQTVLWYRQKGWL